MTRPSKYLAGVLLTGMLIAGFRCSGQVNETESPIRVEVLTAEPPSGSKAFAYCGTFEPFETTPLSFSVTGTVMRVLVSEGDRVEKGQLLAVLDTTTMENAYEMARAALDRAEDAYNRLKPMYDSGSLPEIKLVEVETSLQQAKAAAAIARKNLEDCSLYATVDGFVGSRSIDPGMNVLPGITAIKIVNIDKVYAKVAVSEKDIPRIKRGQMATVTVGALGDRPFEGPVEEVGVLANPVARTYNIKIAIANDGNAIKPGMICESRIPMSETLTGVVVPNRAVQVDENGVNYVYIATDNGTRVERKNVKTGRLMTDGIEITSGLHAGEKVVVAGQQKLVDNASVQIVN